jgi:hypothetical protein
MRMKKQESFSNSIQLKSNVVLKNVLIFLIIQPMVGVIRTGVRKIVAPCGASMQCRAKGGVLVSFIFATHLS